MLMSEQIQGKVVGQLPPKGNSNTQWDSTVSLAQAHPNEAVEVATGVRVVTINAVRQYVRRPPYSTEEGHIEVSCRDSKVDDDGIRRGTMYFRWIPTKKKGK